MTEVKGELTAELAVKLTLIMWEDMAKEAERDCWLNHNSCHRSEFKRRWLEDRGFYEVRGNCLLCEYANKYRIERGLSIYDTCSCCPIDWGFVGTCYDDDLMDYRTTPASKFLEYMKTHVKEVQND